jgi:hypothetical protein
MTGKQPEEKTNLKKITMLAIVCALALGLGAVSAHAYTVPLDLGSELYLGRVSPGTPSSEGDEVNYINTLLAQPVPSGPTLVAGQTYIRSGNACAGCLTAVEDDSSKTQFGGAEADLKSIDLGTSGWSYLLAKYGGGNSLVFDVRGLTGEVDFLGRFNGNGISHVTLYNPGTSVPDGGFTLMLLGGALVGLEGLRRKFRV